MIGMIELAHEPDGSLWIVAEEFAVEMAIGLGVGVAGALLVAPLLRRVRMTGPALYPIRVLAVAGALYGLASVAGGSGFLAVFVAGLLLGDTPLLRKDDIETFQSSLAGLAEIAVFVALGLTVSETDLSGGAWVEGLVLAVLLAFLARPLAVMPLLLPARLTRGERLFIAWGGLKGAVPILMGALALLAGVEDADRLYGLIFVVVLFSVIVQGSSVPLVARWLGIHFRRIDHDAAGGDG
jgi:cell volume regulation protein A